LPLLVAAALIPASAPAGADGVPPNLTAIAEGGVVAVQSSSGVRTGFAFGSADSVILSTPTGASVHLITARGVSAVGDAVNRDGELATVHVSEPHLRALRGSKVREVGSGALAYVLGAPVGYEGERIRAVRLPALRLRSTSPVIVAGGLPESFRGGPIVTPAGRVIGAVLAAGRSHWTLATQARLSTLVIAAGRTGGGKGFPVILVAVGALLAIAFFAGAIVMGAKRRRERAERAPVAVRQRSPRGSGQSSLRDPAEPLARDPTQRPPGDLVERPLRGSTQRSTDPLVRRRGPESGDNEDFEIVVKSREDD
jgi:hypothetical protein